MSTDSLEAMSELFAAAKDIWSGLTPDTFASLPELRYQDREKDTSPPPEAAWGRVSYVTVTDRQAAFMNGTNRKYENTGILTIQIFLPRRTTNGLYLITKSANVLQVALRRKTTPGGIWFRSVRIREMPLEEHWLRRDLIADYVYDELS